MTLALLIAATISAAQTYPQKSTTIDIGEKSIHVPFPNGYCLPKGREIAEAQLLAAADNHNITLLTLMDCRKSAKKDRYLIVKTPISAVNGSFDRSELITGVSEPKISEGLDRKLQSGEIGKEVSERLSDVRNEKVGMDVAFRTRGHDDVCAYMGGNAVYSVGSNSSNRAVAVCITVTNHKALSLNAFRITGDKDAFVSMLVWLKSWAVQLRPAN